MDKIRLYIVTWNVATKSPGQDLNSLLDFPSQYNNSKPLQDFYIVGFQEVKSQPQNLILDSLFTDPWTTASNRVLCRQGYVNVKTVRLQGLVLIVYSLIKHVPHLRGIEAQYTKTGLGGIWGNKGAVSIRFNLYGCSLCIVNSHLTAHEHLLNDRINDYNTIIKSHQYHVKDTINILYHDYVFWLGDLNFRTDHPPGNTLTAQNISDAVGKVEKDAYDNLLAHDQLLACMASGDAFSEFDEPHIRFPPTYKFDIGTDRYDTKRKPSWTDRILYKVSVDNYDNVKLNTEILSYSHIPQYVLSDHKPVVGQYQVKMRNMVVEPKTGITMRSFIMHQTTEASTITESSPDSNQLFSNFTEKTVQFIPIKAVWYIGDADFRTEIILSPDVEVYPNDWIGIFDAEFECLDDYISYEYLAKISLPSRSITPGQSIRVTLSFPVGSGVRTPGFYRFIYFSQPNSDVRSVLGISEPFEVSNMIDKAISIKGYLEPQTNEAGTSTQSITNTFSASTSISSSDRINTDFTTLNMRNMVVEPKTGITMRSFIMHQTTEASTITESSPDSNQLFSNFTEKTVQFIPIKAVWYIGDADFRTEIILSPDVEVYPNDWIGIFDAEFECLDDYISYEYLAKISLPSRSITPGQSIRVTLSFPVGSGVRTPGFYRFIYFSQPNSDVRSVLGISEPFEVSNMIDKAISIKGYLEPQTNEAGTSTQSITNTFSASTSISSSDRINTDFTTLNVRNLSRHFSNDLNID